MEMDRPAPSESPHQETPGGLAYQNLGEPLKKTLSFKANHCTDAGSQIHSDLELTPIPSAALPPAVSGPPLENELHAEAATPVEDLRASPQMEAKSLSILDPSNASSGPALLQPEPRRSLETSIPHGDSRALLPTSIPLAELRSESLVSPSTDASTRDSLRSSVEMTSQYDGPAPALENPRTSTPLPVSEEIPVQSDPSFSTRESLSDYVIVSPPEVLPPPSDRLPTASTPLAPLLIGRSPHADIIEIAFEDKIKEAVEICEHLKDGRIRAEARHNRGKVTVWDYGRSTHRQEYHFVDESLDSSHDLEGVFRNVTSDIYQVSKYFVYLPLELCVTSLGAHLATLTLAN
jgi:hypothetical protein